MDDKPPSAVTLTQQCLRKPGVWYGPKVRPLLRRAYGGHFPPPATAENGAGEEVRTLDVHLGKVVLYQLSYAREKGMLDYETDLPAVN